MRYTELERLVCAGAISPSFREQLLADPVQAVRIGYLGQPFSLDAEEMSFLTDIQARSFQEFAAQIAQWIRLHRNGNGQAVNSNGTGRQAAQATTLATAAS